MGIVLIAAVIFIGLAGVGFLMKASIIPNIFAKPLPPSHEVPSESEASERANIASSFPGRILFDSNRSGSFGIYTMKADGSDITTVSDTELQEIYPDPAPSGEWIVFSRAVSTERTAKADIWLIKPDGTDSRKLASNGTFPTFSGDGNTVYFERGRNQLIAINIDGSNERELFPAGNAAFGNYQVIKPRVSPNGQHAAFISDKKGRWNTWIVDLADGTLQHLDDGCEPAWFKDGKDVAWIKTKGARGGSGLYKFNRATKAVSELQDGNPPRGHEYFPSVVANDAYLLFSSCREKEHSHITANYQIYIKALPDSEPVRITFDEHTNRWPKLLK